MSLDLLFENTHLILLLSGFFGGVLAGLLGVGGGIIIVPVLYFVIYYQGFESEVIIHIAIATSLSVMILTSIFSTYTHLKNEAVNLKILKRWAPYLIVGVLAASFSARYYSNKFLLFLFVLFAFASALRMGAMPEVGKIRKRNLKFVKNVLGFWGKFIVFSIGFFSSLMGIGGGTFTVPLLSMMGASMHRAIGTSAAFGLFISIFGTLGFAFGGYQKFGFGWTFLGFINLHMFAWLAVTSIVGARLGAQLSRRIDNHWLQRIFAFFLTLTAFKMGLDLFK